MNTQTKGETLLNQVFKKNKKPKMFHSKAVNVWFAKRLIEQEPIIVGSDKNLFPVGTTEEVGDSIFLNVTQDLVDDIFVRLIEEEEFVLANQMTQTFKHYTPEIFRGVFIPIEEELI